MAVSAVKADNLAKAAAVIATARNTHKADVVILPECFNCPYGTKFFPEYAEPIPPVGATLAQITTEYAASCQSAAVLAQAAFDNKVWLVGGSIPECSEKNEKSQEDANAEDAEDKAGDKKASASTTRKLYNTSMIFSPEGNLLAKHRKIHLFRINTETVKMDEGEVLTAGDATTAVDVKGANGTDFKVGVGICFDIRFPQLALAYQQQGTSLLVYPGAFNMVTGPPHWIFAAKCRAVDTQQFVAVCSVARDTTASYVAYGHSAVVDPWGEVLVEAGEGEEIVTADIDFDKLAAIRGRLPISNGVRKDLYNLEWKQ